MRRLLPAGFALIWGILPLFPAFITLTGVSVPGLSVVPRVVVFALIAAIVLLAAYAIAMLLRYPQPGGQPVLLPLAAWIGASAISAIAGFQPERGAFFLGLAAMGVVWHCAVVRFYREPGVPAAIAGSYLATGTLAALAAIAMTVLRTPPALYAVAHGRATGTFVLPGELAGYLVVLLPFAVTAAWLTRSGRLRTLGWIATIVGLVALAMTYSRAGWIGGAAAAAFLALAAGRRLRRNAVVVATIAAVAGIALLLFFNAHHDPSEDYTRIAIWKAAVTIVDRYPLTGAGPFDFPLVYRLVHLPDADAIAFHAHDLYLTLFAELGVLGLGTFLWAAGAFVAALRRRLGAASPRARILALALTAGLVGVAVQGLVDTVSIVIFGLWMPTMGLALAVAGTPEPLDGDPA